MTNEIPQPNPNKYELPDDQLAFELNLVDQFAEQFPDDRILMDEALTEVKRFAGYNIPKYKIHEEDEYRARTEGLVDDLGYMLTGGEPIMADLFLQKPVSHTAEEIAKMTEAERNEAHITHSGMTVVGELPEIN